MYAYTHTHSHLVRKFRLNTDDNIKKMIKENEKEIL